MKMKLTIDTERESLDTTGEAQELTAKLRDFWKRNFKTDVPEDFQRDFSFSLMDGKILRTNVDGAKIYLR